MSLYDDFDVVKQKSDGWSSSMKLFQSQMQLKKAAQTQVRIKIRDVLKLLNNLKFTLLLQTP